MATIRWKRADSYEEANNYIGANGEVVVDLAENRLWVYDGANAYVTAAFTQQDGRYIAPYLWAGETAGYLGGGFSQSSGHSPSGTSPGAVQKLSFISDTNAIDVAEMAHPSLYGSQIVNHDASAAYWTTGQIQKTPFASDECVQVDFSSGAPSNSYAPFGSSAGHSEPWSSAENGYYNEPSGYIYKFPFAITLPGIPAPKDWSAMSALPSSTRVIRSSSTAQSETYGYKIMGRSPSPGTYRGTVAKFPFSSDTAFEDVGEIRNDPDARINMGGASVGDKGMTMGGENPGGGIRGDCDTIAFSSDTTTATERSLASVRHRGCGLSSTTAFYCVGGFGFPTAGGTPYSSDIQKSTAASTVNFSDIGDLVVGHTQSSCVGAND